MKSRKINARRKSNLASVKETKKDKKMSKKKLLITIVCIFLAVVLIFGATLGIILGIRNAKALVRLKSVRISEGEAYFLLAKYKRDFLIKHHSYGSDEFWEKQYDEKRTYADLLREESERYLREIAIRCYLFDTLFDFEGIDEIEAKRAVIEILNYRSEGSIEKFDSTAAAYGFTYEDFSSAAILLYKAEAVQSRVFGSDGSGVLSSEFKSDCDEYFENYSHVKLLFIRTEDKFELDENGNRVVDEETGYDKLVELSEAEKAERAATVSEIRAKIEAKKNNTAGVKMSREHFDYLLSAVGEGDPSRNTTGYYFSPYSDFSADFVTNPDGTTSEDRLAIVKEAITMQSGSFSECAFDGGVCFIYKYENTAGAYTDTEDACFSDFASLAATAAFSKMVSELYEDVKIKERYYEIDLVALPGDNPFVPRFSFPTT